VINFFFEALSRSKNVVIAASEEKPIEQELCEEGTQQFSVAFDPLDGSSIFDVNFSVGTIFGIWPGRGLVGRTGREQIAAGYSVYGSRTVLVLSVGSLGVHQFTLDGIEWVLSRADLKIREGKTFAPANLRTTTELSAYNKLIEYYMKNRYTLRYTGGMVPDVHHMLIKGQGVFTNPVSSSSPAKLRLLYECFPLAKVVEDSGGLSSDGNISILDRISQSTDERTQICLGSQAEVNRFCEFFNNFKS